MAGSLGDRIQKVRLANVLDAVREVFSMHVQRNLPMPDFVVLLGGSAMAAHELREQSEDVDFFTPEFDADVVMEVEGKLQDKYGPLFKIDVTSQENVWGQVLVRDIASSPEFQRVDVGGRTIGIRVLPPEDLYLLKLYAGRDKDKEDLDLIAPKIDFENLVARFASYVGWNADPHHLIGYVDRFVTDAGNRFSQDELALIDRMKLPNYVKEALSETREPYDGDEGIGGPGHG